MKKYALKLTVLLTVWGGLILCCFLFPSKQKSDTERRKLTQFPSVTWEHIISGSFMSKFEEYTLDQFPFRDTFRTLSSAFTMYGLEQSDSNGLYVVDGYIGKMDYVQSEDSIQNALDKFKEIYCNYLDRSSVYVSVIPDKNYFLADRKEIPSLDYEVLINEVVNGMPYARYIDITNDLDLESYYKTDTHWKQEEIVNVANTLKKGFGLNVKEQPIYEQRLALDKFYGVYYGQLALPLKSDPLFYLTNTQIESCKVKIVSSEEQETQVYNMDKLQSYDPYEMFLSGAVPIVTIDNSLNTTGKELILFRDSFGSSIAPLLVDVYDKITLIDIRYINSRLIGEYVDFTDKDVLFLYSTLLLNSSYTFK